MERSYVLFNELYHCDKQWSLSQDSHPNNDPSPCDQNEEHELKDQRE
jgi:hypothetical protein